MHWLLTPIPSPPLPTTYYGSTPLTMQVRRGHAEAAGRHHPFLLLTMAVHLSLCRCAAATPKPLVVTTPSYYLLWPILNPRGCRALGHPRRRFAVPV